jgi:hypothetical protein
MKSFCILTIALMASLLAADPFRNLGSITGTNALVWDANSETNIVGYNVFLAETNQTNFAKVATLTTNRWTGDATRNWFGPKIVYVTAFNSRGEESDPSENVLLTFRAGVPVPPNNIQLYSLITAAATSALPPFPK